MSRLRADRTRTGKNQGTAVTVAAATLTTEGGLLDTWALVREGLQRVQCSLRPLSWLLKERGLLTPGAWACGCESGSTSGALLVLLCVCLPLLPAWMSSQIHEPLPSSGLRTLLSGLWYSIKGLLGWERPLPAHPLLHPQAW